MKFRLTRTRPQRLALSFLVVALSLGLYLLYCGLVLYAGDIARIGGPWINLRSADISTGRSRKADLRRSPIKQKPGTNSTLLGNTHVGNDWSLSREFALKGVAQNLGLTESARFKFEDRCTIYTPINICVNSARMDTLESGVGKSSPNFSSVVVVSKTDVENVVRQGAGFEKTGTPKSEVLLKENGVIFRRQSKHASKAGPIYTSLDFFPEEGQPQDNHTRIDPNLLQKMRQPHNRTTPIDPDTMQKIRQLYDKPTPTGPELVPHIPFNPDLFFEGRPHDPVSGKSRKIILWYTGPRYAPSISSLEPLRACPNFPCFVTTNRSYTNQSAAMLFNSATNVPEQPIERRQDQVFIFHNQEPPRFEHFNFNALSKPGWRSSFNWTMTYRLDSDIVTPYGIVRPRRGLLKGDHPVDYSAIMNRKKKPVAAMVSNCDVVSLRSQYIRELSRHIEVDVFGACGNLTCPRGKDDECFERISSDYMFFLSFESSICEDYITEKFFRFLNADLLVVARGSDQYFAHAPKGTFINANDFEKPSLLADRLKYLSSHLDEYANMLHAKNQYVSIYEDYPILNSGGEIRYHHYHYEAVPFCQVCQRLWNLDRYAKSIPDIKEWFDRKLCKTKDQVTDIH